MQCIQNPEEEVRSTGAAAINSPYSLSYVDAGVDSAVMSSEIGVAIEIRK